MTALTRYVWTHACRFVDEVWTHTNKMRVADEIRWKVWNLSFSITETLRGSPLLGSFPGRMGDLVWLSRPPSPIALPLYKLRFHRCSQKHPENAQHSSEWSTYACSKISSDIYIQLFKSPSQVIVLDRAILLQLYWGIQHLYWNPHAHMKVPFIRRECVSLWVFRIGPDTRATCWQLTPTDSSQIRGNAEPSLIYEIFLNFTGRQQDTP